MRCGDVVGIGGIAGIRRNPKSVADDSERLFAVTDYRANRRVSELRAAESGRRSALFLLPPTQANTGTAAVFFDKHDARGL
jgi:hypothetical protein